MFDLDQAVAEWRRKMAAGGVESPEVLNELESHLREEVASRLKAGAELSQGFELAVRQIGSAEALKREFARAGFAAWNRKLAGVAWIVYVVSFFLPSVKFCDWLGWQCALLQRELLWPEVRGGNWWSNLYQVLTLANVFMLVSPFLLIRFGCRPRVVRRVRWLALISVLLVWTFIVPIWEEVRVGCFVWGASFILLWLSTFPRLGTWMQRLWPDRARE